MIRLRAAEGLAREPSCRGCAPPTNSEQARDVRARVG